MFENLSYLSLQQYWWIIVSLLGAILVFMLFVQGGQTLIYSLGKDELKRKIIVNSLGRKWDLTFTTLVTFGGAAFASFPLFYSTSFGGAYWVWMLILFAFIIQAVSYEYRTKANNFLGAKTYEAFLFVNGLLATVLLGIAIATFFTGSGFSVNLMNSTFWDSPWRGLELAFDIFRYETYVNLSLGLAVFFLSRVLASQYFLNNIDDKIINDKSRKLMFSNAIPFLFFFLFFVTNIFLSKGFAYGSNQSVHLVEYKYFMNLIEMPLVGMSFVGGVLLVLAGIFMPLKTGKYEKSIWLSGSGTILTVFSLLLVAGLNNTCFYPSISNLDSSLSIVNASSSRYTLVAMSYVSLMVPFVIAYIAYAWKSLNKVKITAGEMENDGHAY